MISDNVRRAGNGTDPVSHIDIYTGQGHHWSEQKITERSKLWSEKLVENALWVVKMEKIKLISNIFKGLKSAKKNVRKRILFLKNGNKYSIFWFENK